ncbi:MAG: FAD-dependent oxidoreductase [Armatimonadota bacterium]|nr:MAG: FAD-dependent oxidoreductase [Armatimonadota bacterium]
MNDSEQQTYDLVIIGAGPAGGTAAIYAARARLGTLVIDKAKVGGSLAVAPWIANFPGCTKPMPGVKLAGIIKQQAIDLGAEYLQAPVLGVDFNADPKQVFTTEGVRAAKTVIVATGAMGRGSRVPGEDEFLGRGVSYCATCDAAFYDGQIVAVVGKTEEAVDDALLLAKFAQRVYLVAPSANLSVGEEGQRAVEADARIELLQERKLTEVRGEEQVKEIVLAAADGSTQTLEVGGVFIYLAGNKPVVDFLHEALELTGDGCIRADSTMATSIPGVFAAGDVRCTDFRQAITAAGDGAIAAMSADRYVNRRESFRPSR